jgi:hypothetical protein
LGVDQHQRRIAFFGHIDDDQAFVHIHLGGGQTDALGLVHGLQHVGISVLMRASTCGTGLATLCNLGSG